MTGFETHPTGTADLVKRLLDCAEADFGLCDEAAARIEQLEAELPRVAARIEQLEAALTRANAATAAAFEVAATCTEWTVWGERHNLTEASRRVIRALATPDQTAALDWLIAEAEARVWEQAAQIAKRHDLHDKDEASYTGRQIAKDILAASKKGGV